MPATARAESRAKRREDAITDEIVDRLSPEIRKRLAEYAKRGGSLKDLSVPELVERMAAALPRYSRWNDILGPFYRTNQVTRVLGGISRQALDERRRRRTILAMRTKNGDWVYPTLQFDERGRVLPGLAKVLQCFDPKHADDWMVGAWLRARRKGLGNRSVVEWLQQETDLVPVLALARGTASRWAH